MKKIFFVLLFFFAVPLYGHANTENTSLDTEVSKSLVKIRSFAVVNGSLFHYNSSLGVVIDPSGIILTSDSGVHLRNGKGELVYDALYEVCFFGEKNQSPSCTYKARRLDRNTTLDLTLLKVNPVSTLSNETIFSSLSFGSSESLKQGIPLSVFGFLDDERDLLLETQGTLEKIESTWLKSSLVSPYAVTGAIAVGQDKTFLGITTLEKSQYNANDGFVRNIDQQIIDWVNQGKVKTPQASSYEQFLEDLIRAQFNGNSDQTFSFVGDNIPEISLTKNAEWKFSHFGEKQLRVIHPEGDTRGRFLIHILPSAYTVSEENILPRIELFLNGGGYFNTSTITDYGTVIIGGKQGKKIYVDLGNGMKRWYYGIPYKHYVVLLSTYAGEGDRDKDVIETMLQSITWNDGKSISYREVYSYANAIYSFVTPNDFPIRVINSQNYPFIVEYKKIPQASISFIDLLYNGWHGSNGEYLNFLEKQISEESSSLKKHDMLVEITSSSAYERIGSNLPDLIVVDTVYKKESTGEIKKRERNYYIPMRYQYLRVALVLFSSDETLYTKMVRETDFMLQRLTPSDSSTFWFPSNKPSSPQPTLDEKPLDFLEIEDTKMYEKMKGWILLKVEGKGEAYYVHPYDKKLYYLGRPLDAFGVMKAHGFGAGTDTIYRLPWNLDGLSGEDTDKDGLPDSFEDAIKIDKKLTDTDKDGVNDREEIKKGNHPAKSGKLPTAQSKDLTSFKGDILLQIDNHGEAWYVNPHDTKAYFLGRPQDAFDIMRKLGVGISNENFENLTK